MLVFVSGAARSGKSEWAERTSLFLSGERGSRVYLATALLEDEEMRGRVARHREARKGRCFVTLERPKDLSGILTEIPPGATVLLECLPNLVANEMFYPHATANSGEIKVKIYQDILTLISRCRHLVIVSDDLFSDGVIYEDTTEEYLRLLGALHVLLAAKADVAVECVAGLARFAKGSI